MAALVSIELVQFPRLPISKSKLQATRFNHVFRLLGMLKIKYKKQPKHFNEQPHDNKEVRRGMEFSPKFSPLTRTRRLDLKGHV